MMIEMGHEVSLLFQGSSWWFRMMDLSSMGCMELPRLPHACCGGKWKLGISLEY